MALAFHVADYVVTAAFLLISMAIGIYYGFIKKQQTTEEYLLGNRQMHMLPVALSLLVTFQSAISVIGIPAETYVYDTMMYYTFIAICLAYVLQFLLIVPLYYPLRLTSAYEYLGKRFQSRSVQLLGTVLGMIQTLLYMSIVLFAPALSLQTVAGIPLWMSVLVIGAVGTLYTSVGGIKSVVWTDVFQFVMLYGGLAAVLALGSMRTGGMSKVLEVASAGQRVNFSSDSLDPRVRHSVASTLVGGVFNWLPNCCNQSAVQRIASMKSRRDAKIAVLLTIPLTLIYGVILTLAGLLLYSYFQVHGCGPVEAGIVANANQLMPYFVMHVLTDYPGLAGVFTAALFSGALSSLSSGINAMSANTIEDILGNVLYKRSEFVATLLAKLFVLVYGAVAVVLAYLIQYLSGPVTQMALSAMGGTGGPVAGMIFLGATFPQANWIGALLGGLVAIAMNVWIAVGSVLYGTRAPTSPPVSTESCNVNATSFYSNVNSSSFLASSTSGLYASTSSGFPSFSDTSTGLPGTVTPMPQSHLAVYDLSYLYLGLLGFLVSFVLGLVISLITGMDRGKPTEAKFIFPCIRAFWRAGNLPGKPAFKKLQPIKPPTELDQVLHVSNVAPIRSVDVAWYSKLPEDDL